MAATSILGDVLKLIAPNHIKVGDHLEFRASNMDLSEFKSHSITKPYKVISSVPSLDTKVCQIQTQKFNNTMKQYANAQLITISRDLPFASSRVCDSFKVDHQILISDYNYRDFGHKTGLYFTAAQLLCRAVIILDEHNIVRYLEIVNPVTNEPNYDAVYNFLDNHK